MAQVNRQRQRGQQLDSPRPGQARPRSPAATGTRVHRSILPRCRHRPRRTVRARL